MNGCAGTEGVARTLEETPFGRLVARFGHEQEARPVMITTFSTAPSCVPAMTSDRAIMKMVPPIALFVF